MLVDSHCHLDLLDLPPGTSLDDVVLDAKNAGVTHLLSVSVNFERFTHLQSQAARYDHVSLSYGLHPNEESGQIACEVEPLCDVAQNASVVAIGETGLDYYRSSGDIAWQHERFRRHIQAARSLKKPLIIHTRQAKADTLAILEQESADEIGGVFHCFSEDMDTALAAIDLGFYVSFSGIVTFKNAKPLQAVARDIPLDRILVETDSPYLAPTPHRGKANIPSYVQHVAEKIAELRGISFVEVARATTANFFNCFPLARQKSTDSNATK